ncbi:MAG: urea carboxylase-associated family protein [Candidatus Eremiobacteraeota bacterium]|nr:urea carboxylase-associated family protein [Candidatus Eremiobacteraeota bacterium]MBC5804308.1 urea carboxylase-associated family protein [Candidatus Eremiobacteraeota bacterium]MBC5822083.1 urea carboxylase-associated family protein [Candidatus Eremiobacteraeota bacterium]
MPVPAALNRLAPQSGTAFRLCAGDTLVVADPCGEQVADVIAFAADDLGESLSSGRSLDYAQTLYLTTGHVLYSNRSRAMFTIVEDTVGRHDFLLTPCSQQTFEILYGRREPHPSCLANLSLALAPWGIGEDAIGTTFNVFMNVEIGPDGRLAVWPPRSRAGDRIALRAEVDLIAGLTACSAELSNNGSFKPIDWTIRSAPRPRASGPNPGKGP